MSEGRVPVMAGNWKMYKTPSEGVAFIEALVARLGVVGGREVVVGTAVHRTGRRGARLCRQRA